MWRIRVSRDGSGISGGRTSDFLGGTDGGPVVPSPTSFGALSPHRQQLDNPVSTPGRGLTVRLTGRSRQRGQHHAPTGSILGCLYQEFPHWNIDVDIVEFEIEGGRHVGRAYDARRGVVLPSHPPQLLAFGEGQLQPAVAARDGAFDGIFLVISPILQRQLKEGRICAQAAQPQMLLLSTASPKWLLDESGCFYDATENL